MAYERVKPTTRTHVYNVTGLAACSVFDKYNSRNKTVLNAINYSDNRDSTINYLPVGKVTCSVALLHATTAYWEWRYSSTPCEPQYRMICVCCQLYDTATLLPEKYLPVPTTLYAGWAPDPIWTLRKRYGSLIPTGTRKSRMY